MHAKNGAFLLQTLAKLNGWRSPHVVSVLLEGQAEHADFFSFQYPQRVGNFLNEPLHLLDIDFLDFLEQTKVVTKLLRDFDERTQILWETTAAKTQRCIQKSPPDPIIHSHA